MSNQFTYLAERSGLGATVAGQGPPGYTGIQLYTSTQAIPIPIVYGTRRIAPNILWQSTIADTGSVGSFYAPDDLSPPAPAQPDGTGCSYGYWQGELELFGAAGKFNALSYGDSNTNNTDSPWWRPMIFGLCEGPINNVPRMWNSGGSGAITCGFSVLYSDLLGVPYIENSGARGTGSWSYALYTSPWNVLSTAPALFYRVFTGNGAQVAWDFFTNSYTTSNTNSNPQSKSYTVGLLSGSSTVYGISTGALGYPWGGVTNSVTYTAGGAALSQVFVPPTSAGQWFLGSDLNGNPAYIFYVGDAGNSVTISFNSGYQQQNLAYRGTAYIATPVANCGHGNKAPGHSFEVTVTPTGNYWQDSYGLGYDYNIAYALQDLLTNTQYGMGLQLTDIDSTTFALFAAYQLGQKLFFSPLIDSAETGTDVIDRWALISNTWIYWSGTAIMFCPLGDAPLTGYTPPNTVAYNLGLGDFLDDGLVVDRADPIDCYNRVRFEISDRAIDYAKHPIEWKDSTLVNQFGIRDASSLSGDDICDQLVAAMVAQLYGQRMAYIRLTFSFTLPFKYILILPGTIVTLTDPNLGLNLFPVRIRSVAEGDDGKLAVVAEEYPGTLGIVTYGQMQAPGVGSGASGGIGTGGMGSGVGGGTSTTATGSSGGGPGIVMTPTQTLILYVAGDNCTFPATMATGIEYVLKHDQLRTTQPTPALLELNAVTFTRPAGATYVIENPQDGTSAAASVTAVVSGLTHRYVSDGIPVTSGPNAGAPYTVRSLRDKSP
jgi:Putative phage tail protein